MFLCFEAKSKNEWNKLGSIIGIHVPVSDHRVVQELTKQYPVYSWKKNIECIDTRAAYTNLTSDDKQPLLV